MIKPSQTINSFTDRLLEWAETLQAQQRSWQKKGEETTEKVTDTLVDAGIQGLQLAQTWVKKWTPFGLGAVASGSLSSELEALHHRIDRIEEQAHLLKAPVRKTAVIYQTERKTGKINTGSM